MKIIKDSTTTFSEKEKEMIRKIKDNVIIKEAAKHIECTEYEEALNDLLKTFVSLL